MTQEQKKARKLRQEIQRDCYELYRKVYCYTPGNARRLARQVADKYMSQYRRTMLQAAALGKDLS